jgi:hypothetical protein
VGVAAILTANLLAFADTSCPTRELTEAAKKLDKQQVVSVIRLADRWKQLARGRSEECVDELFNEYWGFYHEVQDQQRDRVKVLGRKRLNRELAKVGWAYRESEAGDFVAERRDWIVRYLGSSLPPVWKEYLTERIHDISQGLAEDASLLIGFQELGRMLRFWEDFVAAHPNFPGTPYIREFYIDMYLAIFLNGSDNTPLDEWGPNGPTGEVAQEVRNAYREYLQDGPRAAHYELVRGYFEFLKKKNFKVDEEERAKYLEAHGVKPSRGTEPLQY